MNKNLLRIGTKYVFQVRKGDSYRRGIYKGLAPDGRLIFSEDDHDFLIRSGHYVIQAAEDTTEEKVNVALAQADFLAKAKELEIVVLLLNNAGIHSGVGAIAPRHHDPQVSLFVPYSDALKLSDLLKDHLFQDYTPEKKVESNHDS